MKYLSIGFAAMISILPAWSSLLWADPSIAPARDDRAGIPRDSAQCPRQKPCRQRRQLPARRRDTRAPPSSAFVLGYVLSGQIRSQVDGGQVRVYRAGESWKENPGALHGISENASATALYPLGHLTPLGLGEARLAARAGPIG